LAEQTYQQSAIALNGKPVDVEQGPKDPVSGATFVNEEKK